MNDENTINLQELIGFLKENFYSLSELAAKLKIPEDTVSFALIELRRSDLGMFVVEGDSNGEIIKIESDLSIPQLESFFSQRSLVKKRIINFFESRGPGQFFTSVELARHIGITRQVICKEIREYNESITTNKIKVTIDPTYYKRKLFSLDKHYDNKLEVKPIKKEESEPNKEQEKTSLDLVNPTPLWIIVSIFNKKISYLKMEGDTIEFILKDTDILKTSRILYDYKYSSKLNIYGLIQIDNNVKVRILL